MARKSSEPCTKCGVETDVEEWIYNFGWCDVCFDISWSHYMNETIFDRAGIAIFRPLLKHKPIGWTGI
jgi:hypothetical protein